jgi:hypothetical protein
LSADLQGLGGDAQRPCQAAPGGVRGPALARLVAADAVNVPQTDPAGQRRARQAGGQPVGAQPLAEGGLRAPAQAGQAQRPAGVAGERAPGHDGRSAGAAGDLALPGRGQGPEQVLHALPRDPQPPADLREGQPPGAQGRRQFAPCQVRTTPSRHGGPPRPFHCASALPRRDRPA